MTSNERKCLHWRDCIVRNSISIHVYLLRFKDKPFRVMNILISLCNKKNGRDMESFSKGGLKVESRNWYFIRCYRNFCLLACIWLLLLETFFVWANNNLLDIQFADFTKNRLDVLLCKWCAGIYVNNSYCFILFGLFVCKRTVILPKIKSKKSCKIHLILLKKVPSFASQNYISTLCFNLQEAIIIRPWE